VNAAVLAAIPNGANTVAEVQALVNSASFSIQTISDANVTENTIYTSTAPAITGTPIGTLTYTLSGTDSALFDINATTGE
jgi:hypothetical protein